MTGVHHKCFYDLIISKLNVSTSHGVHGMKSPMPWPTLFSTRVINTMAACLMFFDAASMAAMAASARVWENPGDPRAGKVNVAVAIVQLVALFGEIHRPPM